MARTRTTLIPKNVPAGFTNRALSLFKKKFSKADMEGLRVKQKVSILLMSQEGKQFYKGENLEFKKSQLYAMSHVPGFHALPHDAQSKIMGFAWE